MTIFDKNAKNAKFVIVNNINTPDNEDIILKNVTAHLLYNVCISPKLETQSMLNATNATEPAEVECLSVQLVDASEVLRSRVESGELDGLDEPQLFDKKMLIQRLLAWSQLAHALESKS